MRLGRPRGNEENRSNYGAGNQAGEARVPAVVLDDISQAIARKRRARVAENTGQSDGRGGGALSPFTIL